MRPKHLDSSYPDQLRRGPREASLDTSWAQSSPARCREGTSSVPRTDESLRLRALAHAIGRQPIAQAHCSEAIRLGAAPLGDNGEISRFGLRRRGLDSAARWHSLVLLRLMKSQ